MTRSRLSKKQQQTMKRQTVFFIVLALVLLVVFIFVIMPGFIRLSDKLFNGNDGIIEETDQVPPQTPIISAPVAATNSASLSISGFGEAGSKAVLVLNSERSDEADISNEGKFQFTVDLTEGENTVAVYSVDAANNESTQTQEYQVILDTQSPKITVEFPQDGDTVELRKNQLITIKGSTEAHAKVFINDRLVYAGEDGSFSMSYKLDEGENTLTFKVVDQGGNTSEKEIKVNFRF